MKRKLIGQGAGGATIYLPKKWVDDKGLKSGSEVEIEEKGNYLQISSTSNKLKEITIEISNNNKHDIRNILSHTYRQGFDKIVFMNADIQSQNILREECDKNLLGFEISESGKNKCTIENISEPSGEKYQVLIRRIFLIIKERISLLQEEIKSKSFTRKTEADSLKNQLDKYVLFCRRTISKEKTEVKFPSLEWELLTFLMHIEHSLNYAYQYAYENKCGKNSLELIKDSSNYFELLYDAYHSLDSSKVHEINKLKKDLVISNPISVISKSTGKEAVVASHIRETLRLIQIASSPVLSIILASKLQT